MGYKHKKVKKTAKAVFEGKAKILVIPSKKISKEMEVFYNPKMKLNRDIAVTLLKSLGMKKIRIADPLAGTGVRAIRFLLELNGVGRIDINDINPKAYRLIKKNLKLNNLRKGGKINVHNEEANLFLSGSQGFDYIDIDPFGSPNPYLEAGIKRLARSGILAVTATDTSALCGTHPNACLRKYWAMPLRNELMHEIGLRILIRKIQLIGMQYEKALVPIFSHSTEHYMRTYLFCEKSRGKINYMLDEHKFFLYCSKCFNRKISVYNNEKCILCRGRFSFAGPLWAGQLWDKSLVRDMLRILDKNNKEIMALLQVINEEAELSPVGFYDANKICSRLKLKTPKKEEVVEKIKSTGFYASSTHFSPVGIRSDIDVKNLLALVRKF